MSLGFFAILAAVVVFSLFLSVWLITFLVDDASLFDLIWGGTFGLVAATLYAAVLDPGPYHALIAALPILWAIRYTVYLWSRNLGRGEDDRYTVFKRQTEAAGRSWVAVSFVMVMGFQAVSAYVVSLPLIVGLAAPADTVAGPLAIAGAALWLAGFALETVADWQLARFKRRHAAYDGPYEDKPLLTSGLWRYSRHPNYFGNACMWWGIALVALAAPYGWIGLIGAAYMNLALVYATGKANNEKKMSRRRAYADYVRRTSGFVPLPPRDAADGRNP